VLQRGTKPAKELIAQNPPQDGLQTRATSGLIFAKQTTAADVAGSGSRWQQAGSGNKKAGLVPLQGAQQGVQMARNAICVSFVAMVSVARDTSRRKVTGNSGLLELALLLFAWSPVSPTAFVTSQKMARNARYAFFVAMTLSRAWQVA